MHNTMMSMNGLESHPVTTPANVVQGDRWRISLLTDSLVRFEWSERGRFEDGTTQVVLNRDFPVVEFTQETRDGLLLIDTKELHIVYDMRAFSKEGLSVLVKGVETQFNTWHYGDKNVHNLGGTARTLDVADGPIDLENGMLSFDGWAILDDSRSCDIADIPTVRGADNPFGAWPVPRDNDEKDFYFFGYGHRYLDAIHDYLRLTGPAPLLPRYALGNWWSRFYQYSEESYTKLMDRFHTEGLPFTVAVIDMDWHVTQPPAGMGSGWTGYTWNRELFPEPKRFLQGLHSRGMATALNVHPRDGIRSFEDGYEKAAKTVGIDPTSGAPVEFDLTSPVFLKAYFDLHHDLEADGVDFWWLDWQQGGVTRQKGLDPLWMLNHVHYLDSGRDGKRPLTFSRYAGPGSHRYPVGFSGDVVVSWESLDFQVYFTATASNIGYGWWSHDIGGHMFGYRDEELQARWYQFGAFSPINRLHSTCSPFNGKEPWNFRAEVRDTMESALRLRHAMLPYLYTMNWRFAAEGLPLVEPMYWRAPDNDNAYEVPGEYWFGSELVAAPITQPMCRAVQRAKANVWLPQGTWFDFFDGRRYEAPETAGRRLEVWRGLGAIPVFAKAGGIVPMQQVDGTTPSELNSIANPDHLDVVLFPGADGEFSLVEDDGTNMSAAPETAALTDIRLEWNGGMARVDVAPVHGAVDVVPDRRSWTFVLRGVAPAQAVTVAAGGAVLDATCSYDATTLSLSIEVPEVPSSSGIEVTFPDGLVVADDPIEEDVFEVLMHAQMNYLTKEKALELTQSSGVRSLASIRTLEIGDPGQDLAGGVRSPKRSFAWETLNPIHEPNFLESHMPDDVVRALTEVFLRANA